MSGKMTCMKCGEDIVHPKRKYCLCMDCFMDIIMEHTDYIMPIRYKKEHYNQCYMCSQIFSKDNKGGVIIMFGDGWVCDDCGDEYVKDMEVFE